VPASGGLLAPAVHVGYGIAVNWHHAGWPTFQQGVPHAFATREVTSAPRAHELDGADDAARAMTLAARDLLVSGCLAPGCDSLELRYIAEPTSFGRSSVRMFVTAMSRVADWRVPNIAVDAACRALPQGFVWGTPGSSVQFGDEQRGPRPELVVELRRPEEVTSPQWDYIPADFYYVLDEVAGDGSGWPRLTARLASVTGRVELSFLFAQTDVSPDERHVLGGVMSNLAQFGEARTEYNVWGDPISYPPCENARMALERWQNRLERLIRPVLARVAVRGDVGAVTEVASAVASALSARQSGPPAVPCYIDAPQTDADIRQANHSFDWMEVIPWGGHPVWTHEDVAPHSLRRIPYLHGLDEAAALAFVPVPDEDGVPGMPLTRAIETRRSLLAEASADGPALGVHLDEGVDGAPFIIPTRSLVRHALVVGSPGSGKTTTVLSMLAELWLVNRIPFAVLESAKTEYRSLLHVDGLDDLHVITLGREDVSPFRLNPLAPPPGVRCEMHVGAVLAALRLAMPLFPPLPQLLGKALDRAYAEAGWDDDTTTAHGVAPPTLRSLLDAFEAVFEAARYVGEARDLAAAMRVRLESLLRGSVGRLLDTLEAVDFDGVMQRPTVFELDHISDPEERAVVAAMLLDRIRSAAKRRGTTGGELHHVTVIEEAHRLLGNYKRSTGDSTDPRAESVRSFIEAIAELRALGEGFVLSSQEPSGLSPSAVGNTGVRVVHRLEAATDRACMLDDLAASERDRDVAARLRVGEAIVRLPGWDEASAVRVDPRSGVDSGRNTSDDEVRERMSGFRDDVLALVPYSMCSNEVCPAGCTPAVRQRGRTMSHAVGEEVESIWRRHGGAAAALPEIANIVADASGEELRVAYCTCAHLAAAGRGLTVRGKDIRGQVTKALRDAGASV
jgi:hypothetical protein